MKLSSMVVVGVLVLAGVAHADKAEPLAAALTKLGTAAKCSDPASPLRPWCIAVDFAKGTAINKVTFVAIAIGKDAKVKLTDVKATSADETKAVMEAVGAAAMVFKGKAEIAKLPKELSDYVKTLQGAYKTKKEKGAIVWKGANSSQLRKVGKFYVVIETASRGNGVWVSILTDAWE
jgi:hypothetical protein